jgi:hypothetical protein
VSWGVLELRCAWKQWCLLPDEPSLRSRCGRKCGMLSSPCSMHRNHRWNSNRSKYGNEHWACSNWEFDRTFSNTLGDSHKRISFSKYDNSDCGPIVQWIDYSRRSLPFRFHTNHFCQRCRMLILRHIMLESISIVPCGTGGWSQWCHSIGRQCGNYRSRGYNNRGSSKQRLQLPQSTGMLWIADRNLPTVRKRYGNRCGDWIRRLCCKQRSGF